MTNSNNLSVFNGNYQVQQKLGEGVSSKVYHATKPTEQGNNESVAIKVIQPQFLKNTKDAKYVRAEIDVLSKLDHPNLVKFKESGSDGYVQKPKGGYIGDITYIITEYINGMGLFDFCQKFGSLGEDGARYFMHQIVDALLYMKNKGICHRDLKLENIMLTDDLQMKLIDFGFARHQLNGQNLSSYVGTNTYMSPQIRNKEDYDGFSSDVFSAGVLLFILAAGTFPFIQGVPNDSYYKYLYFGRTQDYFHKVNATNLSEDFKSLFLQMVSYDERTRITLEQIQNHPWMKKDFDKEFVRQQLLQTQMES